MGYIPLYVLAILTISGYIQCISVVGPRVLRPFGSYRVSIAGGSRAHNLYVAVEGKKTNGEQFSQGREVQVQAGTSSLIGLEIGDPGPGDYSLVARSTSGPQFSSSARLVYQPRSFCVFVQTDKRVYQPGDTINFRVIALDKYLLPLANTVDVSILDTGGSSVRQWATVPLDRGVFAEEIVLADEPALGEWTIQVEMRGQTYSKQILVADYVLPKFQMDIQMPKEILFTDGRFDINVTAKHFNGLPVQGELTISAYAVFFSGVLQPVFSTPARKVVEFDGNANVVYDLKTDLDLAEDAARPLVVEAVLEEKDTLIRQNVSSRILLLRAPYRLKITAPNYFKPQLAYNVQIELVNTTGHAMRTDGELTVERKWDDGAPPNTTTVPLKNGLATYSLTPDEAHSNSTLNLLIKYNEVTERIVNIQRTAPADGQYLTVELLTRDTAVGDEMRARITSTEPMDMVHYVVIGRGDILVAKTVELSPARRSVDVKVSVSGGMAPGCVLLAWYPRAAAAARLLAAALLAPQRHTLQHQVSVQPVSPTLSYRPNGLVEFRVSGEPGALAGLLGTDVDAIATGLVGRESLGSGLNMHAVEREVESFSGLPHTIFKDEDFIAGSGIDLGGKTAGDVFLNAGVVILTDGEVAANSNQDPSANWPETGTRAPQAGPYAFSRLPPPPSPRFYLTLSPHNTWMFTNLTLGNDGKGTRERWSPLIPGEWSVGAFAIHPTLGLGLAEPQKFTTSVPLSITAELPETLQKGETLAVIVTLKSTLPVETSLLVTFHNSDQYFEFEPLENTVDSTKKIELFKRVKLVVPARGAASTAFLVSAARAGEAPVIVEANGGGVSASLFRNIDVKEGYDEEVWSWALLDARSGAARGAAGVRAAPGTRLGGAALRAAGDALAPAVLALPTPPAPAADAAYALRPLARACVLLDYLQVTEQDDEVSIIKEAREQVATGYQRLMAFRLRDGSFTQEISDDAEGDVWMTAVATRWMWRATRYLAVSPAAAAAAARWLAAAQAPDGGWPAPPPAARHDPRAQSPVPLAAYALHALLATKGSDVLYKNAINKAVDFIARNVSEEMDAYTLAAAASALAATQHPQAAQALDLMDRYANTTEYTIFWSRPLSGSEWRNPWLRGNSVSALTAAWALRALLAARLPARAAAAAPVARYLLEALPPVDQDPDVLDSLAQYAALIKSPTKLRIAVNVTGFDEPRQFNIDNDNALIIQTQLVRVRGGAVEARAVTEGRGVALLGLWARGATNVTAAWPRYTLDPRVDHVSTAARLQLSVCVGYVAQGNETESGLALLEVQLPSGYLADINTITELTSARHVVGARLWRGGSRVRAWLRARRGEACATLAAPRALPTAAQRPAWATIQDLYDSSHRARVFFQPVASTACDVCRAWPSCERACGAAALQRAPDGNPARPGASSADGKPAPDAAHTHHLAATLAAFIVTLQWLL
ncbi:thioester-containing protein 1 allele S3-like isoform X2 [Epargyreus clarus]